MTRLLASDSSQLAVQELDFEVLLRAAVFKSTNQLMAVCSNSWPTGSMPPTSPNPAKGAKAASTSLSIASLGPSPCSAITTITRAKVGHYPVDAALGLEGGNTPALARLACLEGADQDSYQQAEEHLKETGGITSRPVRSNAWSSRSEPPRRPGRNERRLKPLPDTKSVPILYVSADATGVPMRKEELEGRAGKQPDGSAKTRSAYLGCVFTQHKTDEKGHPVRDYESTTYVSNMGPLEEFGPLLRQEAIRRGLGQAEKVVFLVDGAEGLENMGHLNFKDAIQIVDFYHGADHAGDVVAGTLGEQRTPGI